MFVSDVHLLIEGICSDIRPTAYKQVGQTHARTHAHTHKYESLAIVVYFGRGVWLLAVGGSCGLAYDESVFMRGGL